MEIKTVPFNQSTVSEEWTGHTEAPKRKMPVPLIISSLQADIEKKHTELHQCTEILNKADSIRPPEHLMSRDDFVGMYDKRIRALLKELTELEKQLAQYSSNTSI